MKIGEKLLQKKSYNGRGKRMRKGIKIIKFNYTNVWNSQTIKNLKWSLLLRKWWSSSAPKITSKKFLAEDSKSTYRVRTWNYFIIQQLKASHMDEEDPVRKLQEPPAETSVGKVVFICTPIRQKWKLEWIETYCVYLNTYNLKKANPSLVTFKWGSVINAFEK